MWALALLVAAGDPSPVTVDVYVPLCDGAALACGNGKLGAPRDLDENLYWGARYGAERFLSRAAGFKVVSKRDAPDAGKPGLLREVVVERAGASKGERPVRLRLLAYAGDKIDDAVADFFAALHESPPDVVVWSGHDRLMDVAAPAVSTRSSAPPRVAVLACDSAQFFGPALAARGVQALSLTKSFMAPEAYLLEALAGALGHDASDAAVHDVLVDAYAKYQHISKRAASTVFVAPVVR
jgi:hypothetical protein